MLSLNRALITFLLLGFELVLATQVKHDPTERILREARRDDIDLQSLPFTASALAGIRTIQESSNVTAPNFGNASRVDVHVHVVPDWYRALVPITGGNPTPRWDVQSHLQFMANNSIAHSIVAISTPGADVYLGNEKSTIALARLLNEYLAALSRTYPKRFTFYAAMPLPYSDAAIREANHATTLGAVGIGCLSNHEGHYLGAALLNPFFAALNARSSAKEIIYVHPTDPVLNVNGSFISANPTQYPTGNVEYYFETARTIVDLTISQTILNYTKLNFVIPHVGGAFPAVEDRFIKSYPALEARAKEVYKTRFWWDSAGPTYFAQVKGLLGYGVPTSQLLFGTDYPYAPLFTYGPSIAAVVNADFINGTEKAGIFTGNAKKLFGDAIPAL